MARANAYTGAVLTLFAIYFVSESLRLPLSTPVGPGPGTLPLLYGSLFGLCALIWLLMNLRRASRERSEAVFTGWRLSAVVLGALIVATILTRLLGMLVIMFLFMAFHTLVVERVRWPVAIAASLLTAVGFYLVFEVLLGIPLVIGVLGI
jgi:putative tricarboxylic transport membrane protein